MYASKLLRSAFILFLASAVGTVPTSDAVNEVAAAAPVAEPRALKVPADLEYPADEFSSGLVVRDAKKGSTCPPGGGGQVNQCSSGTPYCCNTGVDGHVCEKASNVCQQTVICCNNQYGFQLCIGAIDFNIPITINVNVTL